RARARARARAGLAHSQRVNVAANLLRRTRGLFDATDSVDVDEFGRYVGALDLQAEAKPGMGVFCPGFSG
ncbi:MAG TPA: hypothetical protein VIG68_06970, partial [Lysobacter sp.]